MMLEHARPGDIRAIVALMNRAFRGTGAGASWSSEAGYLDGDRTTEALLSAEIATIPDAALLVSRSDDGASIRGNVWLQPVGDDVWYLGSLAIDPALQNSGAGRRLLASAEDWVRARGGRTVRMTVINIRQPLIDWYLRRGYALTGEILPFPYGDDRFGVPRRPDLAFVVLEKALEPAR